MADVAAFFSIKTVYEGPGAIATGLFKGPGQVQFGVWNGPMFTARPAVVMFNTEKPPVDTSSYLRPVVIDGVTWLENELGQRFPRG